jgi:RHS repeat-associated protein
MTEYGTPTTTSPARYSWLGAGELATELPSGVMAMGARSYVPQLGRFLQVDPIPGGSANAYAYTHGDPVDESDPTGEYTVGGPSAALIAATAEIADQGAAEQAAINAAARAEAERKAQQAAALAASSGAEPPEGPLGGSAGWAEEYADVTGQGEEGGYGGYGGSRGGARFAGDEAPDDHTPRVESECNRTGQECPGHRGGKGGGKNNKADCSTIATQVETPMMWDPASWGPYAVGVALCQVF